MKSTFEKEFKLIEEELNKSGIMVLATSENNRVTARSMCTLYYENYIYFQTSSHLEKYKQIKGNPRVALTTGFIQLEGEGSFIGRWDDHPDLLSKFCKKHLKSYETYKHLPTQEVVRVKLTKLKNWRYIEGEPYMIELNPGKRSLKITKES